MGLIHLCVVGGETFNNFINVSYDQRVKDGS